MWTSKSLLAVNGQSFLVIEGYLLNSLFYSWITFPQQFSSFLFSCSFFYFLYSGSFYFLEDILLSLFNKFQYLFGEFHKIRKEIIFGLSMEFSSILYSPNLGIFLSLFFLDPRFGRPLINFTFIPVFTPLFWDFINI